MEYLLELFHSEHDEDLIDIEIQMLQDWLVVAPTSGFMQYLLYCFINTEEQMLPSQIVCHTFIYLYQPRPMWNWLMKT